MRVEILVLGRNEGLFDERRNVRTRQIEPAFARIFGKQRSVRCMHPRHDGRFVIFQLGIIGQVLLVVPDKKPRRGGTEHEEDRAGRKQEPQEAGRCYASIRPFRLSSSRGLTARPGTASRSLPSPPRQFRQPQFADPSKRTTYLRIAVPCLCHVARRHAKPVSNVGGHVSRRDATQPTQQRPNTSFTSPCDVFMLFLRRQALQTRRRERFAQCCETATPAGSSEEPDAPASALGGCVCRCAKNSSIDCMTESVALSRHSGDRSSAASFGFEGSRARAGPKARPAP